MKCPIATVLGGGGGESLGTVFLGGGLGREGGGGL